MTGEGQARARRGRRGRERERRGRVTLGTTPNFVGCSKKFKKSAGTETVNSIQLTRRVGACQQRSTALSREPPPTPNPPKKTPPKKPPRSVHPFSDHGREKETNLLHVVLLWSCAADAGPSWEGGRHRQLPCRATDPCMTHPPPGTNLHQYPHQFASGRGRRRPCPCRRVCRIFCCRCFICFWGGVGFWGTPLWFA